MLAMASSQFRCVDHVTSKDLPVIRRKQHQRRGQRLHQTRFDGTIQACNAYRTLLLRKNEYTQSKNYINLCTKSKSKSEFAKPCEDEDYRRQCIEGFLKWEELYNDSADGRMNYNTSTIPTPKTMSKVHAAKMVGSMSVGVFWPVALYKEHHGKKLAKKDLVDYFRNREAVQMAPASVSLSEKAEL